ncbi:GNAT family N-acetyltransferase [Nocardioides albidus]|uniref:GNAT family N-acetyltransferase n=1 Tax=Nocardioides albidus TaxID=1517589 RepID=A0A5C4WAA9_9ACTN|nr:GNAT family N-acetyltransferase [Nocardioides albidus]TNM45062.1 GNAT family N-acetyltransferase [Nocardioides albidus]
MVSADVSVRVAWPADAAGIATVQLGAWQQRYDADAAPDAAALAEAWRRSLSRPPEARRRALVALAADRVVGFALTGPNDDPDADPVVDGEMAEFTVGPGDTRAGHGSRLLQACADTLQADGFNRAVCWVDAADDTLRAFLSSAGWEPDGASRELADESGATLKQVRLHTSLLA